MTDETNVGTQAGATGAGGTTNPPASPPPPSPVAVDAASLSRLVKEAIAEELKPIKGDIGGLYSRQDKDRNTFREFMDEVKKQQASGLSDDAAFDAAQNAMNQRAETAQEKQMLREIHDRLFGSSSTQPAGNGASGADGVARVFESIGLDVKDPRVASALLTQYKSADEVELAAYRLSRQIQQSPNPSPAQDSSLQGGGAQGSAAALDALYAQYAEAFKNPTINAERMKSLEAQIKNLGG